METSNEFEFETWRERLQQHLRESKQRLTDIFRHEVHRSDEGLEEALRATSTAGRIGKLDFVRGVAATGFKCSRPELLLAFELVDQQHTGWIDYEQFVEAFKKVCLSIIFVFKCNSNLSELSSVRYLYSGVYHNLRTEKAGHFSVAHSGYSALAGQCCEHYFISSCS